MQVANLAASLVCRQIMMHTDAVLSSSQIDQLFKALQVRERIFSRSKVLFLKPTARIGSGKKRLGFSLRMHLSTQSGRSLSL